MLISVLRMIVKWGIMTEFLLSVILLHVFIYLHFNTCISVKSEVLVKGRFRYKILFLSVERCFLEQAWTTFLKTALDCLTEQKSP